jgi:Family of unknown function (DUF5681)
MPFEPGKSGNPAGKLKGTRNKTTLAVMALLDGEAETITRKAIQLAKEGDLTALRLCLDRIAPPRKDRPRAPRNGRRNIRCRRRAAPARPLTPLPPIEPDLITAYQARVVALAADFRGRGGDGSGRKVAQAADAVEGGMNQVTGEHREVRHSGRGCRGAVAWPARHGGRRAPASGRACDCRRARAGGRWDHRGRA